MELRVGTSGYSYKEWKGTFYPEKLPPAKMLEFYAGHFDTVEINNTFYRMPKPEMLEGWKEKVPASFRFVLKTPQSITHRKKLAGTEDDFRHFSETAEVLGEKLGPLLVQLPPWLRKDAALLESFLQAAPDGQRIALEFRHESWFDEEIETLATEHGAAICRSDVDDAPMPGRLESGPGWGYQRLRRTEYAEGEIARWRELIEATSWSEAWIFFKHEDEGKGPAFAKEFLGWRLEV
ncbi:MAG: DUF72 domain-containing protein [Acidobacteria bacterium]|nr:DUF72 domain-containing protein [Acidobacteriota bacterium]